MTNFLCTDFISIGWDAPAGQTYSTVSDLGKLMMLVFSDDKPVNKSKGQVSVSVSTNHLN